MAFNATLITKNAQAVTPSDTVRVSFFGIYVGVAGNVTLMPADQEGRTTPTAVLFTAVPAGTIIPLYTSRVMATGTTATGIVGFGPT